MTESQRDQQRGEIGRKLDAAIKRLNSLRLRAKQFAEVYEALAEELRSNPAGFHAVVSANQDMPSRFRDFSAGRLYESVNVHGLNELASEIVQAENRVRELTSDFEGIK